MVQIKLSPFGQGHNPEGFKETVDASQPWPEDIELLQGGAKGLVLSTTANKPSYTTAFVEAFLNNSFYRGEGTTLEEAEKACFLKYKASMECVNHEWESRGYKNGAGFCKHCNLFKSHCFTSKELGLSCFVCGEDYYDSEKDDDNVSHDLCKKHHTEARHHRLVFLEQKESNGVLTDDEKSDLSMGRFYKELLDDK